jgi:hypothetical protein
VTLGLISYALLVLSAALAGGWAIASDTRARAERVLRKATQDELEFARASMRAQTDLYNRRTEQLLDRAMARTLGDLQTAQRSHWDGLSDRSPDDFLIPSHAGPLLRSEDGLIEAMTHTTMRTGPAPWEMPDDEDG